MKGLTNLKGGIVMNALMIILIVIAALFVLTFTAYMTNADGKLIEKIYDKLIEYHDEQEVEENI